MMRRYTEEEEADLAAIAATAEEDANMALGVRAPEGVARDVWADRWNRFFSDRSLELSRAYGIRR